MTSADYMQQIQDMTSNGMPDFKQAVAQAYDAPVLRPLVQESSNLEGQYLPSLFDPFTKMGTGAADLSPAAKLSALGQSMGRLQSRIGANQGLQNFFGGQMSDIAGNMTNQYQMKLGSLKDLANMAFQREQAAQQASQAASARRAAEEQARQQSELLRQLYGNKSTGGMGLSGFTPQQAQSAQYLYNLGNAGVSTVQNAFNKVGLNNPVINSLVGGVANAFLRR